MTTTETKPRQRRRPTQNDLGYTPDYVLKTGLWPFGRNALYAEIKAERLKSVCVGRSIWLPKEPFLAFLRGETRPTAAA